jgi:hypothetical protein
MWSMPICYKQETKLEVNSVQESVKRGLSARAAEEFPLLQTVARERLVKTRQAGKGLAGAVAICEN